MTVVDAAAPAPSAPLIDASRASRAARLDVARVIGIVALLVPLAVFVTFAGFVPLWDGAIYAGCIVDGARYWHLAQLACAGHPAMAYIGLQAIAQAPVAPSATAMLLVDCLLGVLTTAAFARVVRVLFPGDERSIERALLVLALAVQPVVLSSLVQPNVDLPVLAFYVCCLAAFFERRFKWMLVAGTLLAFSKEPGVLLYAVLIAVYAFTTIVHRKGEWREKVVKLRAILYLAFPPLAFALYVTVAKALHLGGMWSSSVGGEPLIVQLTSFSVFDPIFESYLAAIFVLQFMWIPSLFAAWDGAVGAMRWMFNERPRRVPEAPPLDHRMLVLIAIVSLLALTRFKTFSNPRYFLPLYPLVLLCGYAGIVRLVPIVRTRRLILALTCVLFAWGAFRSTDPVSRMVYGTWRAGHRLMYAMTSITGECCGLGRDQLVYNLEFADMGRAEDAAYAIIQPTDTTVIAYARLADWMVDTPLDPRTFRRTLDARGAVTPIYVNSNQLMRFALFSPRVEFLAFPNIDNAKDLELLSSRYRVERVRIASAGAVALPIMTLVWREDVPRPRGARWK